MLVCKTNKSYLPLLKTCTYALSVKSKLPLEVLINSDQFEVLVCLLSVLKIFGNLPSY
jgi:hypothetical protein